jgi:hypothetical protein
MPRLGKQWLSERFFGRKYAWISSFFICEEKKYLSIVKAPATACNHFKGRIAKYKKYRYHFEPENASKFLVRPEDGWKRIVDDRAENKKTGRNRPVDLQGLRYF